MSWWPFKQKTETELFNAKLLPGIKDNPCNCAMEWYLKAVKSGIMQFSLDDMAESLNARMKPELNKYFCKCKK